MRTPSKSCGPACGTSFIRVRGADRCRRSGTRIAVAFDHVVGLVTVDVRGAKGFAIAGKDSKFVWAKARIVAKNQVEVWSDTVSDPVAVRYAWADNPVCNLYSRERLPVTPFRTDDWPGITAENK